MDRLKIAVDGQLLLAKEKTGIGWYAYHMLLAMMHQQKVDFRLDYFRKPEDSIQENVLSELQQSGCKLNGCSRLNMQSYKALCEFIPLRHEWFFGNSHADIYHFFNYFVPSHLHTDAAVVATIHDTAFKVYPETVPKTTRALMALSLPKTCKRADTIVTVSEFSKHEIVKYLGVDSNKILVTYNGVDLAKFHPGYQAEDIRKVKARFGIQREYFLYIGTLEPRKNIGRLIESYALLKSRRKDIPQLVLAGKKGWMYNEIFDKIKGFHLENDIIIAGYLSEADKPLLICGALAFLFVSLYEGFGIPPLEAMACGTPTIVSNCSSLPEVVGESALLAEPNSIESITEKMESIVDNFELRTFLAKSGIERAQKFDWDNPAAKLLDLYQRL